MTLKHVTPVPRDLSDSIDLIARIATASVGMAILFGIKNGSSAWWAVLVAPFAVAVAGIGVVLIESWRSKVLQPLSRIGLSLLKVICELPIWVLVGYGATGMGTKVAFNGLTTGKVGDIVLGVASTGVALFIGSLLLRLLEAAAREAQPQSRKPFRVISEDEARQRAARLISEGRMPSFEVVQQAITDTRADLGIPQPTTICKVGDLPKGPDQPFQFHPSSGEPLQVLRKPNRADVSPELVVNFCPWCGRSITHHYDIWSRWLSCHLVLGKRPHN